MGFNRGQRSTARVSGTSKDYVRGIAGLCEGRIEGLPDGAKDITLNGTPLQNSDGSFNFEDFFWDIRLGTKDQTPFPNGLNEVSIENNINVTITNPLSATRTVINEDVTALRVRLAIQLDNNGQNEEIRFRISIREGAGVFVNRLEQTIRGRYPTFTVFQFFFQVDPTVDEYAVRVEKLSPDSTQPERARNLQWLTLTEVTQKQIAYIGTALIWYNFNSELFQSDPEVGLLIAGGVYPIPTNATIVSDRDDRGLIFAEGWDGTFYTPDLATTDPAWAVYSLLTRPREDGGLGYPANLVNKFDLYQCSLYNNQLISNGFGGQERRYSFNGLITQQQVTLETIRGICATFATKPYWDGTQLRFWQQRPSAVLPKILCNADVRDGKFTPSQGEYQAITTACKVWYTDPSNDYEQSPEPVRVDEAISQYGYFQEEFTALGVITRGAAIRAGRRIIYNSLPKYNKQITFECRPHSIFFRPGEIVQIADAARGRQRKAGLISDASINSIVLDAPTSITDNLNRSIFVTFTDFDGNIFTEQRGILNEAGTYSVIFLDEPLPYAPEPQATWQIVDGSVPINSYQILSIEPSDNPLFFVITAKLYDPNLENKIENGWQANPLPITSRPPAVMPPPNDLTSRTFTNRLEVYWTAPTNPNGEIQGFVGGYIAEYRVGINGDWGNRQNISNGINFASWRFTPSRSLNYFVRVAAISTEGKTSQWIEAEAE